MIWDDRYDDLSPALKRGRASVDKAEDQRRIAAAFGVPHSLLGIEPRLPLDVTPKQVERAGTGRVWAITLAVIVCTLLALVAVLGGAAVLAALS